MTLRSETAVDRYGDASPEEVARFCAQARRCGLLEELLAIFERCGVTVAQAIGRKTHLQCAEARRDGYLLAMRRFPSWGYSTVGELFLRHHTSVLAAVEGTPEAEMRKARKFGIRIVARPEPLLAAPAYAFPDDSGDC